MRRALLALCGLLSQGCDDPVTNIAGFGVPTEVAVSPEDFLGDTSCSIHPGAMRSYVATMTAYDNAEDITPFIIGSTTPTVCSLIAGFRDVIVLGGVYTAEVDGYDVPPEALTPFGGPSSGSRQMRDENNRVVTPRWTTTCGGSASTGAVVEVSRRVLVRPCEQLEDAAPTPTQISISAEQVLGPDPCSVAPTFNLTVESGNLAPVLDVACDADELLLAAVPGEAYQLYATATVGGVAQGALCDVTALPGVTLPLQCNTLTSTGRARVSLVGLESSTSEQACPAESFYDVLLGDEVQNAVPVPCEVPISVGPLDAGVQLFDVVVYDALGLAIGEVSCGAEIAPGKIVDTLCVAL